MKELYDLYEDNYPDDDKLNNASNFRIPLDKINCTLNQLKDDGKLIEAYKFITKKDKRYENPLIYTLLCSGFNRRLIEEILINLEDDKKAKFIFANICNIRGRGFAVVKEDILIHAIESLNYNCDKYIIKLLIDDVFRYEDKIIKILINKMTNINYTTPSGVTILQHYAGKYKNSAPMELINFIIDKGGNINHINNNGKSILLSVLNKNNITLMELLVKKKVNIDAAALEKINKHTKKVKKIFMIEENNNNII